MKADGARTYDVDDPRRYGVFMHAPLSKRDGCPTFTVVDRVSGQVVYGPCTDARDANAHCHRLSGPADVLLVTEADDVAAQLGLGV